MGKGKKHHHTDDDDDDDSHHHESHSHHSSSRDPCLPPHGKTYLTIGQDLYSIQEYLDEQRNATLHWYMKTMARRGRGPSATESISSSNSTDDDSSSDDDSHYTHTTMPVPRPETEVPAALMVYTDIQKVEGLDRPIDYGTGIEYADGAIRKASPPNNPLGVGLQVGLWLGGSKGCKDVISGKLDDRVDHLVYYLGETSQASKIFLRIGYEFDNPEFGYSADPESYKQAFAYIVNKCNKRKSCRRRTVMVWHSWAAGLPANTKLDDFYPGDDFVDWIGVSVFQQFYPNQVGGTVDDLVNVLQFANSHYKPTMIAESTPYGGIHNNPHIDNGTGIWHAWFKPTLHLIKEYDIAMWSYINCNWDVQPMWQGTGFGDTRISTDSALMENWKNFVMGSRRFIRATDYELCPDTWDDYGGFDDDRFPFKARRYYHSTSSHRHDYDDDFRSRDRRYYSSQAVSEDMDRRDDRGVWGNERVVGGDGIWEAVLPLVMLASSLAIVFFMFFTTKRRVNRLERTPRRQRVRFAFLDAKEEDDDGSAAVYGSAYGSVCSTDSDNSRWRASVRRVGPNLLFANTADGTTVVA